MPGSFNASGAGSPTASSSPAIRAASSPTASFSPTMVDDEAVKELFGCGCCSEILYDPVTLQCCGKSFCRGCLRQWISTSVHTTGVPRCPAGCTKKVPFRLPARAHTIQALMEALLSAEDLQKRKEECEEEGLFLPPIASGSSGDRARDAEGARVSPAETPVMGGLTAWREVVAANDIMFADKLGVKRGMPGVLIGNFGDDRHVIVKFDEREDESDLCVNVLPEDLMDPLPAGIRLGQRVVSVYDLLLGDGVIGVKLGTAGVVMGRHGDNRVTVQFDERQDGGAGQVSVLHSEIQAQRLLVGGFTFGQRVVAALDLVVGTRMVVQAGITGTIVAEYSETRITVQFDKRSDRDEETTQNEDGYGAPPVEESGSRCFNVLPVEIQSWLEPPSDLPSGQLVEATMDLVCMNAVQAVVIRAGTRGRVLSGVDDTKVTVSFDTSEGPQRMNVEVPSVKKTDASPINTQSISTPVTIVNIE